MGQKPRHESVRIGVKQDSAGYRHPPVKVSVTSSAHAAEVLQVQFNVFICPNRALEECQSRRKAVALLKEKLLEELDKRYFIRNN